MSELPMASIVIRTHNELRLVRTLLHNVNNQDYPNFEVIVVDSESTDGTPEVAEKLGARIVHIKDEDFTFGYSLNVGCEAAKGEVLVFISGHCYPANERWLKELVLPYKDPDVGLVYGNQSGNYQTKFSENQIFNQYFWDGDGVVVSPTTFCNNANNSIRKSVWQEIPFDESFTGLEDIDWSIRAQKSGYYGVYNPRAIIVHVHDESWTKIRHRFKREAFAMKQIFPQRKMRIFETINLMLRTIVSDITKAMTSGEFPLFEIIGYRSNQYIGAYLGFRMSEEKNLPKRVEEQWVPRSSLTSQMPLSDKNKKFYRQSLLLFLLFAVLGVISVVLRVSPKMTYIYLPILFLLFWLSVTERPKETIEFSDLSSSRILGS